MKTLSFSLAFLFVSLFSFSQSGEKWSVNGNTPQTGAVLGTTNSEPLDLISNNIRGLTVTPTGNLIFHKLFSPDGPTYNGLVFTNGNGQIFRMDFPLDSNQFLDGFGNWRTMSNQGKWLVSGNSLYWNSNVGIGTGNPQYKLDVIGDARISSNLYVGGGIVITDKVQASSEVKTRSFEADSIKMGAGAALYGDTKVEGDFTARYKMDVYGNARFMGTLTSTNGLLFDQGKGISYSSPTANSPGIINIGSATASPLPITCAAPYANNIVQAGSNFQIYEQDQSGNYFGGSLMNMQCFGGGQSSIDASTNSSQNPGKLLINYFCGSNTYLNTNFSLSDEGTVFMGRKVNIGNAWPYNPDVALDIKTNGTKGLVIKDNSNVDVFSVEGNGNTSISGRVKIGTNVPAGSNNLIVKGNVQFLSDDEVTPHYGFQILGGGTIPFRQGISLGNDGQVNFYMSGNFGEGEFNFINQANNETIMTINKFGVVGIGTTGFPDVNYKLSVNGAIRAKKLRVEPGWADFVFKEDYRLLTLTEVEDFIRKNKHLPGIPSEMEVSENGIEVGEMSAKLLQKIEELTLYTIALNKKCEQLEAEIKSLKGKK